MKRMISLLTLAAALAVFAAPVLAQGAKECNDETKSALYTRYYENLKKDQAVSYAAAKEYLTTCPSDDDVYTKALKKFIGLYETATRKNQLDAAYGKKDYVGVISIGKQLTAEDPTFLKGYILMGYLGNWTFDSNPPLASESANYAKKAIEMIEAGRTPENTQAFSKDEALAWLNRSIGFAMLKSQPDESIPFLLKSARYESLLKKDVLTYVSLEQAYQAGPYKKQSEDYKARFFGKDETPESKLALENINQIVDRMIDAYARAAALSSGTDKKALMDAVTEMYTGRNKSDTGINELVAGILSKPVPDVPTPLTSLPTPTPTPGTAGSQSAATNNGASTTQPNKTGTNLTNPAPTGNRTTTGTARPGPGPTPTKPPAKPRSRANHGR